MALIPGISHIIAIKNITLEKETFLTYDCVLCNPPGELLRGSSMKTHLQTREHLLHVLEVDNFPLFKKLKNDDSISPNDLLNKICSYEQVNNKRIVATLENLAVKRKEVELSISELRKTNAEKYLTENIKSNDDCNNMSMEETRAGSPGICEETQTTDIIDPAFSEINPYVLELAKKQKSRSPTQVVCVVNGLDFHIDTEKCGEKVRLVRGFKLSFDSAASFFEKHDVLGKGSVIIFCCGIYSLLSSNIINICKRMRCADHVIRYSLSNVTTDDLISKALVLQDYILEHTVNDQLVLCEIVPITINIVMRCSNNHIVNNYISDVAYASYLQTIEEYNKFVRYHSRLNGFKKLDLLANSFATKYDSLSVKSFHNLGEINVKNVSCILTQYVIEILQSIKDKNNKKLIVIASPTYKTAAQLSKVTKNSTEDSSRTQIPVEVITILDDSSDENRERLKNGNDSEISEISKELPSNFVADGELNSAENMIAKQRATENYNIIDKVSTSSESELLQSSDKESCKLKAGSISSENRKYMPGISYIIALKNASKETNDLLTYDCVLCNPAESVFLRGTAMKSHIRSREHILNVMEIENFQLYEKYKHQINISPSVLFKEVCSHERGSKRRVIATLETYKEKRKRLISIVEQEKSNQKHEPNYHFPGSEKFHSEVSSDSTTIGLPNTKTSLNAYDVIQADSGLSRHGKLSELKESEFLPVEDLTNTRPNLDEATAEKCSINEMQDTSNKLEPRPEQKECTNIESDSAVHLFKKNCEVIQCPLKVSDSCTDHENLANTEPNCKENYLERNMPHASLKNSESLSRHEGLTKLNSEQCSEMNFESVESDLVEVTTDKNSEETQYISCKDFGLVKEHEILPVIICSSENNASLKDSKISKLLSSDGTAVEKCFKAQTQDEIENSDIFLDCEERVNIESSLEKDSTKIQIRIPEEVNEIFFESINLESVLEKDSAKEIRSQDEVIAVSSDPVGKDSNLTPTKKKQDSSATEVDMFSGYVDLPDVDVGVVETNTKKSMKKQETYVIDYDSSHKHEDLQIIGANSVETNIEIQCQILTSNDSLTDLDSFERFENLPKENSSFVTPIVNNSREIIETGKTTMSSELAAGPDIRTAASCEANNTVMARQDEVSVESTNHYELTIESRSIQASSAESCEASKTMCTAIPSLEPVFGNKDLKNTNFESVDIALKNFYEELETIDTSVTNCEPISHDENMEISEKESVNTTSEISETCEERSFAASPEIVVLDDFIKTYEKYATIQKERCPTKIILLLDDRNLFYPQLEKSKDVRISRTLKLSFRNAISFLDKHKMLGKGSLIIFCCGISSLLKDNICNICKKNQCPNPLLKYSIIPSVTSYKLISEALKLQEYILNNTTCDQIMFSELIPPNISRDLRKCGNNHCYRNTIPDDILQQYLKIIEDFNKFVKEHSESMGFKNFELLKHLFPSLGGNAFSNAFSLDSLRVLDERDKDNVSLYIPNYVKELLQDMKNHWNKQSKVFAFIDVDESAFVNDNTSVDKTVLCDSSLDLCKHKEHFHNSSEVNKPFEHEIANENLNDSSNTNWPTDNNCDQCINSISLSDNNIMVPKNTNSEDANGDLLSDRRAEESMSHIVHNCSNPDDAQDVTAIDGTVLNNACAELSKLPLTEANMMDNICNRTLPRSKNIDTNDKISETKENNRSEFNDSFKITEDIQSIRNNISQPLKSNHIPGLAYIIAQKYAKQHNISVSFDCVLCKLSSKERFGRAEMKAHISSRMHLLNVIEVDHHEMFVKYKDDETVTSDVLYKTICKYKLASDTRIITTAANHNRMRLIVSKRIKKLKKLRLTQSKKSSAKDKIPIANNSDNNDVTDLECQDKNTLVSIPNNSDNNNETENASVTMANNNDNNDVTDLECQDKNTPVSIPNNSDNNNEIENASVSMANNSDIDDVADLAYQDKNAPVSICRGGVFNIISQLKNVSVENDKELSPTPSGSVITHDAEIIPAVTINRNKSITSRMNQEKATARKNQIKLSINPSGMFSQQQVNKSGKKKKKKKKSKQSQLPLQQNQPCPFVPPAEYVMNFLKSGQNQLSHLASLSPEVYHQLYSNINKQNQLHPSVSLPLKEFDPQSASEIYHNQPSSSGSFPAREFVPPVPEVCKTQSIFSMSFSLEEHLAYSKICQPFVDKYSAERAASFHTDVHNENGFQKIMFITYPQYFEYFEQFDLQMVEVVTIPSSYSSMTSFIKENANDNPSKTLWLTHTGLFNISRITSNDFCLDPPCEYPLDIVLPYDESLINSEKFLLDIHHYAAALTEEVYAVLSPGSAFLVLPPIPPTFIQIEGALHDVYHRTKQNKFYYSTEKGCRQLGTLFTALSKETTMLALSQLEMMTLPRHDIENYFNHTRTLECHINLMTYKEFISSSDATLNPQFNLWYKCITNFIKACVNKECTSHPDSVTTSNSLLDTAPSQSSSNIIPIKWSSFVDEQELRILQMQENILQANFDASEKVATQSPTDFIKCDHIVFLGVKEDLNLVPKEGCWAECVSLIEIYDLDMEIINRELNLLGLTSYNTVLFAFIGNMKLLYRPNTRCDHTACLEANSTTPAQSSPSEGIRRFCLISRTLDIIESLRDQIKTNFEKCQFLLLPLFPINMSNYTDVQILDQCNIPWLVDGRSDKWINLIMKFLDHWRSKVFSDVHSDGSKVYELILQHFPEPVIRFTVNMETDDFSIRRCKYFLRLFISRACSFVSFQPIFRLPHTFFRLLIVGDITAGQVRNLTAGQLDEYIIEYKRICEVKKNINFNLLTKYNDQQLSNIILDIMNYRDLNKKTFFNFSYIISSEKFGRWTGNTENMQYICHKFSDSLEDDCERLLKRLGNIRENSVCILVLKISLFTQILSASSACGKFDCQKAISVLTLPIQNIESDSDSTNLKTFILKRISNVMAFVSKLATYIPVVILPFFPARVYIDEGFSYTQHKLGHLIVMPNTYVVAGSKVLWEMYVSAIRNIWLGYLKLCYEKYFISEKLINYIDENLSFFVIEENDLGKFSSKFEEIPKWNCFFHALLEVLVKSKKMLVEEAQELSATTASIQPSKEKEIIVIDLEPDSPGSPKSRPTKSRSKKARSKFCMVLKSKKTTLPLLPDRVKSGSSDIATFFNSESSSSSPEASPSRSSKDAEKRRNSKSPNKSRSKSPVKRKKSITEASKSLARSSKDAEKRRSKSSNKSRSKSPVKRKKSITEASKSLARSSKDKERRYGSKSPTKSRCKSPSVKRMKAITTRACKSPLRQVLTTEHSRTVDGMPSDKRNSSLLSFNEPNTRKKLKTTNLFQDIELQSSFCVRSDRQDITKPTENTFSHTESNPSDERLPEPDTYQEYLRERTKLMIKHREEYDKYYKTPELHSSYEMYSSKFCSQYKNVISISKDGPQDWKKLWKAFWNSKMKIIEQRDWKRKEGVLFSNFEANAKFFGPRNSNMASESIEGTVDEISQASNTLVCNTIDLPASNANEIKERGHKQVWKQTKEDLLSSLKLKMKILGTYKDDLTLPSSEELHIPSSSTDILSTDICKRPSKCEPTRVTSSASARSSSLGINATPSSTIVCDSRPSKSYESFTSLEPIGTNTVYPISHSDYNFPPPSTSVLVTPATPFTVATNQSDNTSDPIHKIAGGFSIVGALNLLEQVSGKLGLLGQTMLSLSKSVKDTGPTSREAIIILSDKENLLILQMVINKLQNLIESTPEAERPILFKVLDWTIKLMNYGNQSKPRVTLDINALTVMCLNKTPQLTLDVIKRAFATEGKPDPTKEEINEVFLKICSLQLELTRQKK